jgi:hypothetical protein
MKVLLRKLVAKIVEGNPVGDEPLESETAKRSAWPFLIKRCSPRNAK